MVDENGKKNETFTKANPSLDKINRINFASLVYPKGARVLPLDIRNASIALRIMSHNKLMSSRGARSMLSIGLAGRVK